MCVYVCGMIHMTAMEKDTVVEITILQKQRKSENGQPTQA